MGKRISKYEYQKHGAGRLMKPIIFCCPEEELEKNAIALNVSIAEKLINVKPERRSLDLPSIVDSIIAELPENSTIKDFDVLFNPVYQIDVLRLLTAACRKKEFAILWPGTYSDGKLMYARDDCLDYKIYDLDAYDVSCVV